MSYVIRYIDSFGFASALAEIGLPQTEIPAALLAFIVGVEIGPVVFIATMLFIFWLITRSLNSLKLTSVNWLQKIENAYGIWCGRYHYALDSRTCFRILDLGYASRFHCLVRCDKIKTI